MSWMLWVLPLLLGALFLGQVALPHLRVWWFTWKLKRLLRDLDEGRK